MIVLQCYSSDPRNQDWVVSSKKFIINVAQAVVNLGWKDPGFLSFMHAIIL